MSEKMNPGDLLFSYRDNAAMTLNALSMKSGIPKIKPLGDGE